MVDDNAYSRPGDKPSQDLQLEAISSAINSVGSIGKLFKLQAEKTFLDSCVATNLFEEMDLINKHEIVDDLLAKLTNG